MGWRSFVVLDVYRHVDINENLKLGLDFRVNFNTIGLSKLWNPVNQNTNGFAHHTRGQGRGSVITAKRLWMGRILQEYSHQYPVWFEIDQAGETHSSG